MNRQRYLRSAVLGTLGAFAAPAVLRAETYTLRASSADPATQPASVVLSRFASAVNKRANGQLNVEVYFNGTLAKQREMIDGLVGGIIDFTSVSAALLQPIAPAFQIFDLPFLFKDTNAAYRVFDGPLAAEILAPIEAKGILGLAWGNGGYKEIGSTTKAISVPDDMKGIRMRVVGGALDVAIYQSLGAIPVTVDLAEAYTALSQHTVDAIDVPLSSFAEHKFYVVAKHMALANHILSVLSLAGSRKKIESLPAPLQRIVREEARGVMPFWRDLIAQQADGAIPLLKNNGVAFTDVQYAPFRKAVDPVYAMVQSRLGGDLLARVVRATGGTG